MWDGRRRHATSVVVPSSPHSSPLLWPPQSHHSKPITTVISLWIDVKQCRTTSPASPHKPPPAPASICTSTSPPLLYWGTRGLLRQRSTTTASFPVSRHLSRSSAKVNALLILVQVQARLIPLWPIRMIFSLGSTPLSSAKTSTERGQQKTQLNVRQTSRVPQGRQYRGLCCEGLGCFARWVQMEQNHTSCHSTVTEETTTTPRHLQNSWNTKASRPTWNSLLPAVQFNNHLFWLYFLNRNSMYTRALRLMLLATNRLIQAIFWRTLQAA